MTKKDPPLSEVERLLRKYGDTAFVPPRIKSLREQRGWTLEEVVDRFNRLEQSVHLTRQTMWKIEHPNEPGGRKNVTLGEALAFSKIFDVSLAELLLPDGALVEATVLDRVNEAADILLAIRNLYREYEDKIIGLRALLRRDDGSDSRALDVIDEAQEHLRSQLEADYVRQHAQDLKREEHLRITAADEKNPQLKSHLESEAERHRYPKTIQAHLRNNKTPLMRAADDVTGTHKLEYLLRGVRPAEG